MIKKHGHGKRGQHSGAFKSWRAMRARCLYRPSKRFAHYGGRGISICERWEEFVDFLADMGERPEGLTLDRIDVNGNYEPGNCRWATRAEQRRNQRGNKLSAEKAEEIKNMRRAGASPKTIGEVFGVSSVMVGKVVRGECWA